MKYKRPEEFKSAEAKELVSSRIDPEARAALVAAAKRTKMSLSELVAHVLEDYAKFIQGK